MKTIIKNGILVIICASALQTSNVYGFLDFLKRNRNTTATTNNDKPTPTPAQTTANTAVAPVVANSATSLEKTVNAWPVKRTDIVNEDKWVFFRSNSLPANQTPNPDAWKKEFNKALNDASEATSTQLLSAMNTLDPASLIKALSALTTMYNTISDDWNKMSALFKQYQDNFANKMKELSDKIKELNVVGAMHNSTFPTTRSTLSNQLRSTLSTRGISVDQILTSNPTTIKPFDLGLSSS